MTLRVEPQPGERDVTNNELSSFVKVFGGGLNVFYMEGELRVEQRFLRRALSASPDIKVDFEWIDHRLRKKWPIDLAERFRPGKYDVYIIGDLDSKAFRPEDLQALRQDVERGAGLIMLGGFHSFWSGGYQDTALRDILPLEVGELDKFDRQNFDEPIREKLHIQPPSRETGLKMLPDRRFGDVSIMRLGPRDQEPGDLGKAAGPRRGESVSRLEAGSQAVGGHARREAVVGRRRAGSRPGVGLRRRFDLAVADGRLRERTQAILAASRVVASEERRFRYGRRLDQAWPAAIHAGAAG